MKGSVMSSYTVICIALSLIDIDCSRRGVNPPVSREAPDTTISREARVVSISEGNLQGKNAAPIRISVRLIDGSQLIGTPNSTVLPLRSPYGVVDVQLEQVASIVLKDTTGSVRVEFRKGDILQGNLQNESLSLETLLGTLSVPLAQVRTIRVLNPTNSITNGLVAYYPLDGNTDDFSGHGHNAVNHGAVPGPNRSGSPGKALEFGGTGEYVALPEGLIDPEASEFTFSLWLLTRTLAGYHAALYFGAKSAEAAVWLRDGKFVVGPGLVDGQDHGVSATAPPDVYTHLAASTAEGNRFNCGLTAAPVKRTLSQISRWFRGVQSTHPPSDGMRRNTPSMRSGLVSSPGTAALMISASMIAPSPKMKSGCLPKIDKRTF
jgi:hypothetical protein